MSVCLSLCSLAPGRVRQPSPFRCFKLICLRRLLHQPYLCCLLIRRMHGLDDSQSIAGTREGDRTGTCIAPWGYSTSNKFGGRLVSCRASDDLSWSCPFLLSCPCLCPWAAHRSPCSMTPFAMEDCETAGSRPSMHWLWRTPVSTRSV